MRSNKEILTKAGESFTQKLRDEFDVKNLNDTREGKNSVSFSATEDKLEIKGLMRLVVLQNGRRPGRFPPVSVIEGWVRRRKLNVEEDKVKSTAFLIARKISEKGTDIFTDKAKGLQIELLIEELNTDLFEEISTQAAFSVTESIFKAYE